MGKSNIICMIPARIGSQRFKKKNLALIQDKTVLEWGIEAAIKSNIFDKIIVNGDHPYFNEIAYSKNVDFYERNKALGSSETKSDDVIMDFLNVHNTKYLVWFNAIAPFQSNDDIKGFVGKLTNGLYHSMFAVRTNYIQALYKDKPINYNEDDKFAKTQDLNPIKSFVPSLMGWDAACFQNYYKKNDHGLFCGSTGYYEVSTLSTLVIKKETDFRLIRSFIEGISTYYDPIEYYQKVNK